IPRARRRPRGRRYREESPRASPAHEEELRAEARAESEKKAECPRRRPPSEHHVLENEQDRGGREVAATAQAIPRRLELAIRKPERVLDRLKHSRAAGVNDPAADLLARPPSRRKERVHVVREPRANQFRKRC